MVCLCIALQHSLKNCKRTGLHSPSYCGQGIMRMSRRPTACHVTIIPLPPPSHISQARFYISPKLLRSPVLYCLDFLCLCNTCEVCVACVGEGVCTCVPMCVLVCVYKLCVICISFLALLCFASTLPSPAP